jgi:hypothetical protein
LSLTPLAVAPTAITVCDAMSFEGFKVLPEKRIEGESDKKKSVVMFSLGAHALPHPETLCPFCISSFVAWCM